MSLENENNFKERLLLGHLKKFNFPRLAGTEGEEKAVDLVLQTFNQIGHKKSQINTQPFKFSDFYSTTCIKLIGVLSMTFLLILVFFSYILLFFKVLLLGTMALVVLLIINGLKHPEIPGFWGSYYGKIHSATNVYVKIPATELQEKYAGNIVVSAHLDTKSQNLRTIWRIRVYMVWLYSGMVLGIFYVTKTVYLEISRAFNLPYDVFNYIESSIQGLDLIMIVLMFFVLSSNTFLLFLNTHNKSPGGLDNASGMAIVFELSRFFKSNPLKHYNLYFCQFSAEELGTMGSRLFVNEHENEFEKGKIFQFNFDMVSAAGTKRNILEYIKSYGVFPRKKIAPILSKIMQEAAEKESMPLYGFHITTGAHTDTVPFHHRKYNAIDIVTRASAYFTHSKEDRYDRVDPAILKSACSIARTSIMMLDSKFKSDH